MNCGWKIERLYFITVDCQWLEWSVWSACSVSCGGGIQERTRGQIPPQHDGKPCVGDNVDTRTCNNNPCPGEVFQYVQLACLHVAE